MTTATIYVEHLPLMGSIHDRATVVGNFGRKLHLTPEVKPVPGVDELTADIARSLRSEGVESKVAQRLLEILEHHDEWAEEDEPPLDSSTILRARDILEFFEPVEQSQSIAIFPSEEGGITLRSIHDGISVAVEFRRGSAV